MDQVAYKDGNKASDGLVEAGVVLARESWHGTLLREATVYDREVEAIVEAIRSSRAERLLILTDCQLIVKAVDKATGDGIATRGVVGRIWREAAGREIAFVRIKAHIRISGIEAADITMKRGAGLDDEVEVTPMERG